MGAYYVNEAMLTLPDVGFEDHTLHTLRATTASGGDLDLVIRRAPIPDGKSLRAVVDAHVDGEARALLRYAVLAERESTVDGAPTLDVASRWAAPQGPVYQRQAHLCAGDLWLSFLMMAPMGERAACDAYFDEMLGSVRLRDQR